MAVIISVFFSACRFWQKTDNAAATPTPAVIDETSSVLPFSSKEPESYQAEIVTQILTSGEKSERKILTVRSGARRLTIFDVGEKMEISALNSGSGSSYSIYKAKKVYTENKLAADASGSSGDDFLTTEWLNAKTSAAFENLGTENNLTKFRARLGGSENSEVLIYIDENLKIPVKQEFYTIEGESKVLTFSIEVKNFKPQVDEKLFELPKDYRQISAPEWQELMWHEKVNRVD